MQPGLRSGLFGFILCLAAFAWAQAQVAPGSGVKPASANNPLAELFQGKRFLPPQISALQADDFDNPAFPLVLESERRWRLTEGSANRSCMTCHDRTSGDVPLSRAAAGYPKFDAEVNAVITLEQRINRCRETFIGASPWSFESAELVGMTAYVKHLSRGAPYAVRIDGPAAPVFIRGKTLYEEPAGRLGLPCAACHNKLYGQKYSGATLSQGHPLDYPAFDVSEQKVIPLHERFRMCNRLIKAEPKALGDPDYVALELYLAWRSQNLPIDAPGVRP